MRVVHIIACVVLLVAIASSDPQEQGRVPVHIAGPGQVIASVPKAEQCTGGDGFCVEADERCNGTIKFLHNSCSDRCTCCLPNNKGLAPIQEEVVKIKIKGPALVLTGSSAKQCTGLYGFCVEAGERCNSTIKFLHNSSNDTCSCCVPDNQGTNEISTNAAPQKEEGISVQIIGPAHVTTDSPAEQCTGRDGFCVEADERCNGTIKFLHSSSNGHCTCCVPDKQGFSLSNSTSAAPWIEEGIMKIHITGETKVITGKKNVPTAEQCTGEGGACVEANKLCSGTIKFLRNPCNDTCNCCVPDNQGCPEGFSMSTGSKQCFKIFTDKLRTWKDANKKCKEEGLILSKPSDEVAVALRKDLLDTHGNGNVWLNARGDGSKMVWQEDGTELKSDSPLWRPEHPGKLVTTKNCLGLSVKESSWSRYPEQPYHSASSCTLLRYTLCEESME